MSGKHYERKVNTVSEIAREGQAWYDREMEILNMRIAELEEIKRLVESDSIPTSAGKRLKAERLKHNISVEELAADINEPWFDVMCAENGDFEPVSPTLIKKACERLGVAVEYVVSGTVTLQTDIKLSEVNGISDRARNALARSKINTVGEFMSKTAKDLEKIRNFGNKSFQETVDALRSAGYKLPKDWVQKYNHLEWAKGDKCAYIS